MNKHIAETSNDIGTLVEQGKELADHARGQVIAGAKATHKAVQKHPYQAMAIGLGVGAILGFLLARRSPKHD
jgi:ElaB/YqjD/DUF883 family membrane-anchored ribosome-binding protein